MSHEQFTAPLLAWYEYHGRKNLPWQAPYDPYRVWLSEIMLQQTQVKTVIPYFNQFITQFPTIKTLAESDVDDVLRLWAGLGYYSRARNLHKTAQRIVNEFNGEFPKDLKTLMQLPGIGQSTAAAIISLAFNQPCTILDGNVKRVLSRYFLIEGLPNQSTTLKQLWKYASLCASQQSPRTYTQAIMDLGATCCTPKNPSCTLCPVHNQCSAFLNNRVHEFPAKPIKQKLPIRKEQFLLLYTSDKKVYLEKRPPQGIWGGLWSLPAIAQTQCIKTHLKETWNFTPVHINPFMKLKHIFTHFQLHIDAWQILLHDPTITHTATARWFKPNELLEIGLPKAVKTLVEHWIEVDEMMEAGESV